MTDLAKPVTFPGRRLFGPEGLLRATAIKAALLLGLVVYGTGFAILCPLAQASASKSAEEGTDLLLHIGP
ncbi:MAG: hypothetical protein JO288_14630 [Hyphomicrobiales bacterium]|nr:hypothetical protein [Hyphomicrobiales bacterium]